MLPSTTLARCALLALLAGCGSSDEGEWVPPEGADTRGGVTTEQVPLAQLVPAVSAGDPERGTCDRSHRQPSGFGLVQMSFPGAPGETRTAMVMLDPAGEVMGYTETRRTATAMTSILIDPRAGTGGVNNVTEGGARMTIGRGTADEALRSEALGNPARTIERMLARCGRPGATR